MQKTAGKILQTAWDGLGEIRRGASLDDCLDRLEQGHSVRKTAGFLLFSFFRHKKTIDRLLKKCIVKPPEKRVFELLELAAVQIFFCSGIARESAVNVAVDLIRGSAGKYTAGFVNAVLRKMTAMDFPEEKTSEDILPDPVLKHWRGIFSPAEIEAFAGVFQMPAATTFRRTAKEPPSADELAVLSAERLPEPFPNCPCPFYRTGDPAGLFASNSWKQGFWYIQDPAAAAAVSLVDFRCVRKALDICAAPGGKSLMIAENLPADGFLVAADRSEARQKFTRENFRLRGWDFPTPAVTPENLPEEWGDFDLVLADVPCSNTGVFRHRPDALWRFRSDTVPDLKELQENLLEEAGRRTARGGILLYSTCSIEPEENEIRCREFLAEHPEFQSVSEKKLLPSSSHDGAYARLMKKR